MSLSATRFLVRRAGSCSHPRGPKLVSFTERPQLLQPCRRWKSSSSGVGSPSPPPPPPPPSNTAASTALESGKSKAVLEAERQAYLRNANEQMKKYHETRELLRQGKLKNINAHRGPKHAGASQAAVAVVFLGLFIMMPFLGRKIARDDEFREKWVPSWYDYTVPRPDKPWTRDELHEQMLMVQQNLRERAIAGEFAPKNLEKMQSKMQGKKDDNDQAPSAAASKVPQSWDTFQPALGEEEDYNEAND